MYPICACSCDVPLCRSLPAPEQPFSAAVVPGAALLPRRVAFSPDLGVPPVCKEVVALCR